MFIFSNIFLYVEIMKTQRAVNYELFSFNSTTSMSHNEMANAIEWNLNEMRGREKYT